MVGGVAKKYSRLVTLQCSALRRPRMLSYGGVMSRTREPASYLLRIKIRVTYTQISTYRFYEQMMRICIV
jgi:hypothetical protein|eukprot:COSAG03_NODE_5701_length_1193_cov_4.297075_2_plen_70_part_00